ncbi:GNAT family N-acetyltransferase, partial [Bacillus pseudomycoides]
MVNNLLVTQNVHKIFQLTEEEAKQTDLDIVLPVHLFLGCLQTKSSIGFELRQVSNLGVSIVRQRLCQSTKYIEHISYQSEYFNMPISEKTLEVIQLAEKYMQKYKQVYINEGHIIKALFDVQDNQDLDILSDLNKDDILRVTTIPRDMIVQLRNYVYSNLNSEMYSIRRATIQDYDPLMQFVSKEFSDRWAENIKKGFSFPQTPIFLAFNNDSEIIGFAAYDVVRDKKGLFGPMGVSLSSRIGGGGYSLLHHCLQDMKDIGYEYAIIGNAGPIEFYERTCNAVVIPYKVDPD